MLDVSLIALRVLLEVARQGSFSAAATALGYTQSAVSRQVAVLESAAGDALFVRRARGVSPTPAGEVLVRHAEQVVGQLEAASLELEGLHDRLAGRLTVGAFPTAAAVLLPRAIARLTRRHPDLALALHESSSPKQVQRLRAGRIEVAVVASGPGLAQHDLDGLGTTVMRTARGLGVALSAEHPLAAHDIIDVADLSDIVWIVGAGSSSPDEPQFGPWPTIARPRIGFEAGAWPTRLGMVAAGLGLAVLPRLATQIVPEGVVWRPVHDPAVQHQRDILLLTGPHPSRNARAAVQAVRAEFTDLGLGA